MVRKLITITGLALATVAVTASIASAMSPETFKAALGGAGYEVSVDEKAVEHSTLGTEGTLMTIEKGSAKATVEFLAYPSQAELEEDWVAVNGASPTPNVATTDFEGKVLYWNVDSVLAVDFRPPNDAGTAQVAGKVFLGERATGGPAAITLPNTGTGDLLSSGGGFGFSQAVLLPTLAGVGALLLASAHLARRLAR